MFFRRSRKSDIRIELPPDGPEDGGDGLGWTAMADLGREVVAASYPGESSYFDAVLADFRSNPSNTLRDKRLKAPVGVGVDLAIVTPYVLATASFLFGVVAERATDHAIDVISAATRDRLARILRRRGRPATGDPAEAGDSNAGEGGESGPADGAPPPAPAAAMPIGLDRDQEREVFTLVKDRALALGLEPAKADLLGEAMVGALRLRYGNGASS